MWAQALGFEMRKRLGRALRGAAGRISRWQEIADPERRFRQLPGEMMVAALPEASAEDARMKKIFMNNCTGCHSTSYALQFRFDEAGWSKIIDLMKVVPVTGVYPGPNAKPNQISSATRSRSPPTSRGRAGPARSSMKVASRARARRARRRAPSGRSTTCRSIPTPASARKYNANDGTDWAHGHHLEARPAAARRRAGPRRHDLLHQQQPEPRRDDRQGRSRRPAR